MFHLRDQAGKTVLEVAVGLAIGSILLLLVVSAQTMAGKVFTQDADKAARLQAVRNGLDRVVHDIQEAQSVTLSRSVPALTYFDIMQITPFTGAAITYYRQGEDLIRSDGTPRTVAAGIGEIQFAAEGGALPVYRIQLSATTETGQEIQLFTRAAVRMGGGAP